MEKPSLLKHCLLLVLALLHGGLAIGQTSKSSPRKQPNILLIMADDLTFRDIEPYGNTQVKTPNLSRLAKEGMTLDNMYSATAMCAPNRQQLYTGMFPVRNGAFPNHSQVYAGTKSVAHHLQAVGYNTALLGKKHYGNAESFPFTYLGGRDHDDGTGQDIDLSLAENFIKGSKAKPYFLVVASNQPHGPLNRGNAAAYPPAKIKVPADLVDTDATRKQLSLYFAEITYLDSLVGVCLDMVERSGQKNNTVVMFASEHGSGFPFAKWTTYDSGLKAGFIVRWPGQIKPGTRTKAMTQYVDVVPTLVDIAGGNPSTVNTGRKDALGNSGFDGTSFKKVLLGQTNTFRDYVYGVHTTRGVIQGSDSYPIRSVRSTKYLYINNLNAQARFQNVATSGKMIESWSKTGKPEDAQRAEKYVSRPAEELYDVEKDPFQLTNLAGSPALKNVQQNLKGQLAAFMKQQGDLGLATEMKAFERQPKKGMGEDEEEGAPAKGKKAGKKKAGATSASQE
ncbi:sulfatase family protein [Rufibacter radiotolerans]|uniref:sulfatase family protein n=1 Tax=Rufibacter radiotolerans TaxID=1379910 RepID=UPI000664681E|nr:sulfatase [Rufibacter radiotolerans]